MSDKPWVKINSETYIDCIVGNEAGLLALKSSIDEALEQNNSKVEHLLDADFHSIVLTTDELYEAESTEGPWWQIAIFKIVLCLWLILLPIYALYRLLF